MVFIVIRCFEVCGNAISDRLSPLWSSLAGVSFLNLYLWIYKFAGLLTVLYFVTILGVIPNNFYCCCLSCEVLLRQLLWNRLLLRERRLHRHRRHTQLYVLYPNPEFRHRLDFDIASKNQKPFKYRYRILIWICDTCLNMYFDFPDSEVKIYIERLSFDLNSKNSKNFEASKSDLCFFMFFDLSNPNLKSKPAYHVGIST